MLSIIVREYTVPYFDSLKSAMTVLLASAEEVASAKTKDRAKKDLIVSSVLGNQTTSGLTV